MLDTQYRMHPEIAQFPVAQWYDGRLANAGGLAIRPALGRDAASGVVRESMLALHRAYGWLHVGDGREEGGGGRSISNRREAAVVAQIVAQLEIKHARNGIVATVGVVSFYSGQVREMGRALAQARRGVDREEGDGEVVPLHRVDVRAVRERTTVATVDGFQGAERDIMVVSFVRTTKRHSVGFLADFRRLNVALTRARHSLLCVGDVDMLAAAGGDLGALARDARARGRVAAWDQRSSGGGGGGGGRYVRSNI
jgi:superfamily I DNA and/or RNA helicase